MIVAVDHLACEVDDFAAALVGTVVFTERGLPCAREKSPYLRLPPDRHDIAVIERPGRVRREVTCHPRPAQRAAAGWTEEPDGTIVCPAADEIAERRFLCAGLRGQELPDGRLGLPGGFARPPHPLRLVARDLPLVPGWLDEPGCTCLALICSRIDEDLTRCVQNGGRDATVPFSLTVHGRLLAIALLRSPAGHPIELIQPLTRNTT